MVIIVQLFPTIVYFSLDLISTTPAGAIGTIAPHLLVV
jgi:hypothetical protein